MKHAIKLNGFTLTFFGVMAVLISIVDASTGLETSEERTNEVVEIEFNEELDEGVEERRRQGLSRGGPIFPLARQRPESLPARPVQPVVRTERNKMNGLGTYLLV